MDQSLEHGSKYPEIFGELVLTDEILWSDRNPGTYNTALGRIHKKALAKYQALNLKIVNPGQLTKTRKFIQMELLVIQRAEVLI